MHWHPHTLWVSVVCTMSGLEFLDALELLDAHELPIFHLRPLGTPRMLLCHAALLTPAQPGIQNHTHGLPCLRVTKGSIHGSSSTSSHPSLPSGLTLPPCFPHWLRAETNTRSRSQHRPVFTEGPHLLLQVPGVLTVSQF